MQINEILEIPISNKKDDGILLIGSEFEKNALYLLYKNISKRYLDKYIQSKMSSFDLNYVNNLSLFDKESIKNLLYICRFCSYFGKKYFSDLIVLSDKIYLAQQIKESIDNELFILLCALFGFEIRIYSTGEEKSAENSQTTSREVVCRYAIDVSSLITLCMSSQPYSTYWSALKNVHLDGEEREKLEYDMKKLPFSVLEKWLSSKEINIKDLEEHMIFLEESNMKEKEQFKEMEKKLYIKDLEELDYINKVEYLKNMFAISEFKAIEFVNFIEWKD